MAQRRAQRSRKRGRRGPPPPRRAATSQERPAREGQTPRWEGGASYPRESRSERKNAEVRAALKPLAPGERPWVVAVSAGVAAAMALANLIAWLAGDTIGGKHPAATGIVIFSVVLLACAVGLWRLWYGAVLGFMALMAIIAVLFTLYLIEASNLLGAVVALAIIVIAGYLFFKLVRVLSRIQMPRPPER